jgi:dUTP pyrophosphatase
MGLAGDCVDSGDAVRVRIARRHPAAIMPCVMQAGDVAADLFACEAGLVPRRGRALIATGWALELPVGFRGRIHSRSGLSLRDGIEAGAGLIDQGFRHPLSVLLFNHSDDDFVVQPGDRIAQLCIERYTRPMFEEVEFIEPSARTAGWGSTGVTAPDTRGIVSG